MAKQHASRKTRPDINAIKDMNEQELIEAIICCDKPPEEAKELSQMLMHEYMSCERIFGLGARNLARTKGVDKSTAVLLSLVKSTVEAMARRKNKGVWYLSKTEQMKSYCENILKYKPVECFLLVTLNSRSKIMSTEIVSEGTYNEAYVNQRKIMEIIVIEQAKKAIIAHNHPHASSRPSQNDIQVTYRLKNVMEHLGVTLVDHIIVGRDKTLSMKADTDYVNFESSKSN